MSTLAQDELEKRVDAKVTAFVACVLSNLTDEDARRVDFRVPPGVCAKHMSPYARASPRTFRALTCASTTTARSFSPARSRGGRGKSKFVYKSPLPKYAARQRPKNTAAGSRTHASPGAATRSGGGARLTWMTRAPYERISDRRHANVGSAHDTPTMNSSGVSAPCIARTGARAPPPPAIAAAGWIASWNSSAAGRG